MTIEVDGVIYRNVTQTYDISTEGYLYLIPLNNDEENYDVISDLDYDIKIIEE